MPMIQAQEKYSPAAIARWRPLAGPFSQDEEELFRCLAAFLRDTGARVFSMQDKNGNTVTLYRLRSEMETIDDTRRRLKRFT